MAEAGGYQASGLLVLLREILSQSKRGLESQLNVERTPRMGKALDSSLTPKINSKSANILNPKGFFLSANTIGTMENSTCNLM